MSSHDQKESGEENTAAKRGSHINIRKKGGAGNGIDGFSVDDELFSSLFFFIFKQGKELTPLRIRKRSKRVQKNTKESISFKRFVSRSTDTLDEA